MFRSVQKGKQIFCYDVGVELKCGNSQLVPQKTNKNFEKEEGKYHSDTKCDSVMVEVKTSGSDFHVRISTRSKGNIQKNTQKDPHTTYTMARDCNSDISSSIVYLKLGHFSPSVGYPG